MQELKDRKKCLRRLMSPLYAGQVRVITGVRGCGKTSMLRLMEAHLKGFGVAEGQILRLDFEKQPRLTSAQALCELVRGMARPGAQMYLLLDEIQHLPQWEDAVAQLHDELGCEIFIASSDGRVGADAAGPYVRLRLLPLSLREYLDFYGFEQRKIRLIPGTPRLPMLTKDKVNYRPQEVLAQYVERSGMPALAARPEQGRALLEQIVTAAMPGNEQGLWDTARFLAAHVGENLNMSAVGEAVSDPTGAKAWVERLCDAGLCYEICHRDIRTGRPIRARSRYYMVDEGIRNFLLGDAPQADRCAIENLVCAELLHRGYQVETGRLDGERVDYIATRGGVRQYIQVVPSMISENVRRRVLAPLDKISNFYEKTVISPEPGLTTRYGAVRAISLVDWLIEEEQWL